MTKRTACNKKSVFATHRAAKHEGGSYIEMQTARIAR